MLQIKDELWKPIINYKGLYEISNYGKIKSFRREGTSGGFLVPSFGGSGYYLSIYLSKNGKRKLFMVHKLVLEIFVGPCPYGMEGCHNDGNAINNFVGNLRWDTHSNNMQDCIKQGTFVVHRGSEQWKAILNDNKIIEIRKLIKDGISLIKIAKMFYVHPSTIADIKFYRTWTHIKEEKNE